MDCASISIFLDAERHSFKQPCTASSWGRKKKALMLDLLVKGICAG